MTEDSQEKPKEIAAFLEQIAPNIILTDPQKDIESLERTKRMTNTAYRATEIDRIQYYKDRDRIEPCPALKKTLTIIIDAGGIVIRPEMIENGLRIEKPNAVILTKDRILLNIFYQKKPQKITVFLPLKPEEDVPKPGSRLLERFRGLMKRLFRHFQ